MRVSKEQAAQNRERILGEAARLFREHGFDGVGVDGVMKAAGLTHGGFYNHFRSKEDLITEAVARGLDETSLDAAGLDEVLAAYLSSAHRAAPGVGCLLAALGPDMGRQSGGVRAIVTNYIAARIDRLADLVKGRSAARRRRAAIATYAGMVGAMVLARVVDDDVLSDEILAAAREAFGTRGNLR